MLQKVKRGMIVTVICCMGLLMTACSGEEKVKVTTVTDGEVIVREYVHQK